MKPFFKMKSLTAAMGVAMLGMGTANTAHANAYAYASNLIDNFQIIIAGGTPSIPTGSRTTTSASTVNGTDPSLSNGPVPLGASSDVGEACIGLCVGNNNFANNAGFLLSDITFGRGDAFTSTGRAFDPSGVANVYALAESNVVGTGTSTGSGGNAATINGITVSAATTFTIQYTVDSNLYAWTAGGLGDTATASIAAAFTLTDTSDNSKQFFAPTVCSQNSSVTAPPNFPVGSLKPGADQGSAAGCSVIQSTPFALVAGRTYNLALSNTVNTNAVENVPEPASMLLVGSALSALAFTTRRRRNG
jgi:hypothetical protein